MYHTAKVPVQYAMEKMGVKGRHAELRLARSFLRSKALVTMMDEMPANRRLASAVRKITGQPVLLIEAFDNGVSLFGGLIKSVNKNLTLEEAIAAVHETILDANFRAGWDQPYAWKEAAGRAAFMFQSTPYKLMEFKLKMIRKALKGEKDIFGTHYGSMLIRYAVVVGLAEMLARANGTTVWENFLHIPFSKERFHRKEDEDQNVFLKVLEHYAPSMPPPLQYVVEVDKYGFPKATAKHLSYWGQASKIQRILEKDIPKRYDSGLRYLLGLKSTEKKHEQPFR